MPAHERWKIPVTADGALVQDGYRPRDGDRMVEVVPVVEVERLREVCARAARLAESERAELTVQVLREAADPDA